MPFLQLRRVTTLLLWAAGIVGMSDPAFGAQTYCCASTTLATTTTTDALRALETAVDSRKRCRRARCDCDGDGSVTVTDAMRILEVAVSGGNGKWSCPTTPTTTTTTLPPSCGNDNLDPGEDCDPPFSFCRGGCNPFTNLCVDLMCSDHCTCPPPLCGDDIIDFDAGESCDPPGSPCESGTCNDDCACGP